MTSDTFKKKDIKCYIIPTYCYRQIRKFSRTHFKDSIDNLEIFDNPSFLPNKLKFSCAYYRSILIRQHSTIRSINLSEYLDKSRPIDFLLIFMSQGRGSLCTTNRKSLNYYLVANHTYRIPKVIANEEIFIRIKDYPFTFMTQQPAYNKILTLSLELDFNTIISPPKFAFIDCEIAWAKFKGVHTMVLTNIVIIDENGDSLLHSPVSPVLNVYNYVSIKTGLSDKKLRGKLDERIAIHKAQIIFRDHILVGCGITHVLKVLKLDTLQHHRKFNLGTSEYLRSITGIETNQMSLKDLSEKILNKEIQSSRHNLFEEVHALYEIFDKYRTALIDEYLGNL